MTSISNTARKLALALLSLVAVAGCKHAPPKAPPGYTAGLPAEEAPPPLKGHNLLYNETFDQGSRTLPWNGQIAGGAEGRTFVDRGELCMEVKKNGKLRWDTQLRHQHLTLQKGHTYAIQFKMRASQKTRAFVKLGQAGPPYKEYWKLLFALDDKAQVFAGTFKMTGADDPSVELAFHLGGQLAMKTQVPFTVCLDDAHIDDPEFVQKPLDGGRPVPDVLVNQVGYFPRLAKIATVKNPNAVPWELLNDRKEVVASGTTVPFGDDKASGDKVSVADFSAYVGEGSGYTLKAGGAVSHTFDIREDIYAKLKYHALAFFYQQRSGIAIEMPYAEDPSLVHKAGHLDVPPNKGDKTVPCAPGSGCSYSLDVSGGWYDAGDQGKYVVNAGISVWTLLNYWERIKAFGGPGAAAELGDGKMNIPENKNGVADLLDEVRWELDFVLKMQVPAGEKLAGMAHHKIHDQTWAPMALWPGDDPIPRYLQAPSTAATLNLAAIAAQAARVWEGFDKPYAARCLEAAERAWAAALAHPDIFAPATGEGGGPYDDKYLDDDFYWAAAELFVTTRKAEYKDFVTKSKHFKEVNADWNDNPGMATSMTWGDTKALGSISLALVANGLPKADVDAIKKNIVDVAERNLGLIQKQGYRLPFGVPAKGYPWGSSSFVLTNALMLGLAHDLTKDVKYLNGVVQGMDYILGRNPLDQSYVTGYGDRPLENPYHRFWCYGNNEKFPKPPAGVLSGGPNTSTEDSYAQAAGLQGCAPQKCFVDHGEAWSVNEVTINWNAPLAWVALYLDEKENAKPAAASAEKSKAKGKAKEKN